LQFDSINLFLGDNGAGKSTAFSALANLQTMLTTDANVNTVFGFSDYTRWQTSEEQYFELEIEDNNDYYKYELKIEKVYNPEPDRTLLNSTISFERLFFNQKPLIEVDLDTVKIYSDNLEPSLSSRYNYYQSIIPLLKENDNNKKIIWFRERMKRLVLLKTHPGLIQSISSQKDSFLKASLENYVSWYRYIFENNPDKRLPLVTSLQEILEGFIDFKLDRIGEKTFLLLLLFKNKDSNQTIEYSLSELSDGEKMLIVLYSLFYGLESQDYTLCIDEPDNFLALPEIQPWLFKLEDLCNEGKLQALLISHHPELINYLLASPIGYWFERQANSSVKVKPINSELQKCNESGLSMSELIARRWLDD